MSEAKKPLHLCEGGCGVMVTARKKRCGPCTAKKLDEQRATNLRKTRERRKKERLEVEMVTRRVIQTYKTLPGRHHEAEVECPNNSAQLLSFSIEHRYKEEWTENPRRKEYVEYTTITAQWVIKNWAD